MLLPEESGPQGRNIRWLPGKGNTQEEGQEGSQDMDRERSHLENCSWQFGRRWHAMGAQDARMLMGVTWKTGLPTSDLRVRPGPNPSVDRVSLRLLSLLLSSLSHCHIADCFPRTKASSQAPWVL